MTGASPSTSLRRRPIVWAVVIVVAVSVLSIAALTGAGWGGSGDEAGAAMPGDSSVAAGFARDMQRHHAQAVLMSLLVLDDTEDEAVRTLARDVLLTQQQQIGQMHAWLRMWGLNQTSSAPTMGWMSGHGAAAEDMAMTGHGDSMPGWPPRRKSGLSNAPAVDEPTGSTFGC